MSDRKLLFSDAALSDFLSRCERQISVEIDEFTSDYLLGVIRTDLADAIEAKHRLDPIILHREQTFIGRNGDTKIDVTGQPQYGLRMSTEPLIIPGTFAEFVVPFEGDERILMLRPSTFSTGLPRAKIVRQEIRFYYARTDHDQVAMRASFDRDIELVEKYVQWGSEEVNSFNTRIVQKIRDRLDRRLEKFLKDKGLVESLGFPIKAREKITSYAPVIRKNLPLVSPTKAQLNPEPRLELEQYEHILSVISDMSVVMERSPKAFSMMGEEDLRTHILVQLNGHYQGRSTGETFNFDGKTDILIREHGKNIFIGECKIWKGAEVFTDTINQLLGYAAWRDTKTAIILFNRNKDLTNVLSQIPGVAKKHANFRRQVFEYKNETGFRFIFHHRDDPNRDLMISVLVFDVPINLK